MTSTLSLLAHDDIRQALDRALESPNGIKLTFDRFERARSFRSRCNYFRANDRRQNKEQLPEDHPLHSNSIYDKLMFIIDKSEPTVLRIEKVELRAKIEEL